MLIFFPACAAISDAGTIARKSLAGRGAAEGSANLGCGPAVRSERKNGSVSSRGWTERGNPIVSDSWAHFRRSEKSGRAGILKEDCGLRTECEGRITVIGRRRTKGGRRRSETGNSSVERGMH